MFLFIFIFYQKFLRISDSKSHEGINPEDSKNVLEQFKTFPKLVYTDEISSLHFHQDDIFFTPKIKGGFKIYVRMQDIETFKSANLRCMAFIWNRFLTEYLNDITYLAEMASFKLSNELDIRQNMYLKFTGYNDS